MSGQSNTPQDNSLEGLTKQCLNMKPVHHYAVKVNELKDKLNKNRQKRSTTKPLVNQSQKPSNIRSSPRLQADDRQKIDDSIRSLSGGLKNLSSDLDTYTDSINEIMDMISVLYERLEEIDKKLTAPTNVSYADITRSNLDAPVSTNEKRLEKLEYQSSENERLNRVHQVTITHPALDGNTQNLFSTASHFMENIMMMDWRQIDANMYVQPTRRRNTILISFSDQRFKSFLFKARKNLPQQQVPIYINDYLTNYNYKILKLAKEERKRNYENLTVLFETVYSFNGRIFIKKRRSDPTTEAILVKSPENLEEIVKKLADGMSQ